MPSFDSYERYAIDATKHLNERLTELERSIRRQFEIQWYTTSLLGVILMIGVMVLLIRQH